MYTQTGQTWERKMQVYIYKSPWNHSVQTTQWCTVSITGLGSKVKCHTCSKHPSPITQLQLQTPMTRKTQQTEQSPVKGYAIQQGGLLLSFHLRLRQLTDWLTVWLTDWLAAWLTDWLTDWWPVQQLGSSPPLTMEPLDTMRFRLWTVVIACDISSQLQIGCCNLRMVSGSYY